MAPQHPTSPGSSPLGRNILQQRPPREQADPQANLYARTEAGPNISGIPVGSLCLMELGPRLIPLRIGFSHVALLHAICGLASLYSPIITDERNDPDSAHFPSGSFNSAIIFRPNAGEGVQGKHYFPKSLQDIMDIGEEGFGAAHIRWAAASLRLSVREGDRLLQLLQSESRWNFSWLGFTHAPICYCVSGNYLHVVHLQHGNDYSCKVHDIY